MANALIANNVHRPVPRQLIPRNANGQGDVRIIQYQTLDHEVGGVLQIIAGMINQGVEPGDILVLAQRGVVGTPIFQGLVEREIPVRSYYAEAELDAEDAQRRFAILKLFANREDRVALRWLLGLGSNNWLTGSYQRLRAHCDANASTPWTTLEQLAGGAINIPYTAPLVQRFGQIRGEIAQLETVHEMGGLVAVVEHLFPANDALVREIRTLSLSVLDELRADADRGLFLRELTSAIAKPEIPTEMEEVRVMSLHKSKGLSAPVTIIAGCVEGLLPKQPDAHLPHAAQVADLEEQRRLFYVGITRVKASPEEGKVGALILTYARQMPLAAAMSAGIAPAGTYYGSANLIASRFVGEMGQVAPAPVVG